MQNTLILLGIQHISATIAHYNFTMVFLLAMAMP
jgi:hypothetical protein